MSASPVLDRTWAALPENLGPARLAVLSHLEAADTPDPPLNDIRLATSEAVTNVIHHAYVGADPGPDHQFDFARLDLNADPNW